MIVKIFRAMTPGAAFLRSQDGTIKRGLVLDETLQNKMCHRDRAYFNARLTADDEVEILKRLPDQGW